MPLPVQDIMKERSINSEIIYEGKFLKFVHHDIEIETEPPIKAIRQFVLHPGGVCVIAITNENKIVLVQQYRKPIEKAIWEIPAGKIDPGEDTISTAKRELQEETGYTAKTWRKLGEVVPCPGYSDEILYLYLAKDMTAGNQNLDHGELVNCQEFSFDEIKEFIKTNKIQDAKTISALYLLDLSDS